VSSSTLYQELQAIDIPLTAIYLDPNNPRFVAANSKPVSDAEIDAQKIQEDAQRLLVRDYDVEKLRMNMEVNGYLPIDRIVVRSFKKDKYVVLEGNRRIAAAKMINNVAVDGSVIASDILHSLDSIPCLEYVGSEQDAAWIFQGLRHITGIREWSAYNKARLLVEQMEENNLKLGEVGKRFGLSAFGAGQWVRGYFAFKQAREESDYLSEVDERSYPYFQELFGRSSASIRDWMNWDGDKYKFKDALKFNEFVGWLYPRVQSDDTQSETKGDFEKRRVVRRDDLRTLASLLTNSPKYFEQFRTGSTDLEVISAMASAEAIQEKSAEEADRVKEVLDALSRAIKALDNVPHKMTKLPELKSQLSERTLRLKQLISDLEDPS
jgi:hypothetical protein